MMCKHGHTASRTQPRVAALQSEGLPQQLTSADEARLLLPQHHNPLPPRCVIRKARTPSKAGGDTASSSPCPHTCCNRPPVPQSTAPINAVASCSYSSRRTSTSRAQPRTGAPQPRGGELAVPTPPRVSCAATELACRANNLANAASPPCATPTAPMPCSAAASAT